MHDISNRILRPMVEFLGIVFAKTLFDYSIYYITQWTYPEVIFWESVIVFFFLFYRYSKRYNFFL